ncbi:MAG: hypothetical protein RQ899_15715 [Pseudomonadales bacterium]|nr:hypothetical protein [Pseudomonadales bacterium]
MSPLFCQSANAAKPGTLKSLWTRALAWAWLVLVSLLPGPTLLAQTSASTDTAYLDVSLSVFKTNIPETEREQLAAGIYPRIRQAEARYIPFYLRENLAASMRWGAVRVMPEEDPGAELLISGEIIESRGNTLILHITARDSRNHEWLNKTYQDTTPVFAEQLNDKALYDPFQSLYRQVISELEAKLASLDQAEIALIKNLAMLRYASGLAPETFASFVQTQPDGSLSYARLPAANDPLFERVKAIRNHEYLFVDTVDEQYRTYFQTMKPVYDLWRQYNQDQSQQLDDFETRRQNRSNTEAAGTYEAYRRSYRNFSFRKLEDQYLEELAQGFDNELKPNTLDLEDSVVNLSGTLEAQYAEWQDILKSFYLLETGAAPDK